MFILRRIFYVIPHGELDVFVDLFSVEYVINVIYAILKGKSDNNLIMV